nr:uncharacterized protein LOC112060694 [Chrysemys picta bellii]
METMVPGRMPRAGLLLLPLLLCFGPETAGSINPAALREIGDHVNKDGLAVEYAFAISLEKASCENPSGLEQMLRRNKLQDMQAAINAEGSLYDPDEGPIVAARMKHLGRGGEHTEWRLLQGDQNSPVQKLLARPYNERSCLIFFTVRSPCAGTCLLVKRPHNILQMVSDTFRPIDHNYKAFVFRQIYWQDRDLDPQSLLEAWHRLPDVPLLRCDTKGCRDCSGNDPNTDTNACLDEMRAMRQPLHLPGRGQEGEQGAERRAEDVGESREHLQRAGEMVGQGAPLEGWEDSEAGGDIVTLGGWPDIEFRRRHGGRSETTGSINPAALKKIVDHVSPCYRSRPHDQYTVTVSLPQSVCKGTSPNDLERHLPMAKLQVMKSKLQTDLLYEGNHTVAAKPDKNGQCSLHSDLKDDHCIQQLMDGIFGAIDEDRCTLAFKEVFGQDRNQGKQLVWNSWQTLCNVPMYQRDDQGCQTCEEKDVNKNSCQTAVKNPATPAPKAAHGGGRQGERRL